MFKKLVANLPFNPGLIEQIGFYSERLKKERSVRRLSFLLIAMTMVIQIVAVAAPPERSLAASNNDIIYGGARSKTALLNAWDRAGSDLPAIYGAFGVTRSDIAALSNNPNTTLTSNADDYWSIGRTSLSGYSGISSKYKNSEVSVRYKGQDTTTASDDKYVYHRSLRAWDRKNPVNYYSAFKGTIAKTGKPFWIIASCGNLTTIGEYTPPPIIETAPKPAPPKDQPKPAPEPEPIEPKIDIKKQIVDNPSKLNPGDTYTYNILYKNTVPDSLAKDVVIEDQLDTSKFSVVSPKNLDISNGFLRYEVGGLKFEPQYRVLSITVRLKDQLTSGDKVCNEARIKASNASSKTSPEVCVGIIVECPYDSDIDDINNPNCIEPKLVCDLVDASVNLTTREVLYKTNVTSSNPKNTTVKRYVYEYGDGSTDEFTSAELMHEATHTYEPGDFNAKVTVYFMTTGQEETEDKSIDCAAPIEFEEDQPLGQSKSVSNITQDKDGEAAIESIVQANDVLEYTLTTINPQNYERIDVEISDYIGDVLDYATLDEEFLKEQNGTFDADSKKLIWNKIAIAASGKVEVKFRVKIKDPIPTTNSPNSVGTDYDCKISNAYGNEITMDINCPLVKSIESLPNTGPGANLVATIGMTTVVGYFFARSRLLAKELDIIRKDYVISGGM